MLARLVVVTERERVSDGERVSKRGRAAGLVGVSRLQLMLLVLRPPCEKRKPEGRRWGRGENQGALEYHVVVEEGPFLTSQHRFDRPACSACAHHVVVQAN